MYIPKAFTVNDKTKLIDLIRENSFGILFSQTDGQPFATHLPFLVKESGAEVYLLSHMAKVNPHWKDIQSEVLVVFQGPHAYISPVWYEEPNTLPTWNYVTVHVYGEFELIEEPAEVIQLMGDTIDFYESNLPAPWNWDSNDEAYNQGMLKGIAAFKIKVKRMEGKWKLGQNHSIERQQNLVKHLRQSSHYHSQEIADLIERNILERGN